MQVALDGLTRQAWNIILCRSLKQLNAIESYIASMQAAGGL